MLREGDSGTTSTFQHFTQLSQTKLTPEQLCIQWKKLSMTVYIKISLSHVHPILLKHKASFLLHEKNFLLGPFCSPASHLTNVISVILGG